MLDIRIDIADINPMPMTKIQNIMEFAILIAANVSVECFAAIKTSVAPINICPKLPIIIGIESDVSSAKYFLKICILLVNNIVIINYHNKTIKQ